MSYFKKLLMTILIVFNLAITSNVANGKINHKDVVMGDIVSVYEHRRIRKISRAKSIRGDKSPKSRARKMFRTRR